MTHIYFRQMLKGLEIQNANLAVNVAEDGRVINVGGAFVPDLQNATVDSKLKLDAATASIPPPPTWGSPSARRRRSPMRRTGWIT